MCKLDDSKKLKLIQAGAGRVTEDDIVIMQHEIVPALQKLITMCGGNPDSNGMMDTPYRIIKAWLEMTEGYQENPAHHLLTSFDLEEGDFKLDPGADDIVIVKNIRVLSVCEHHILPFVGKAHVGYLPKDKAVGISKLSRLVQGYSKRFQIQEKLGHQIVTAIMEEVDAAGAIVYIDSLHTCMVARGVREHNANTVTIATRGAFREDKRLEEKFLIAIGGE